MPTRAGWAMLGLSIGTIVAGRLLALLELFVLGGIGVALCLLAVLVVRRPDGLTITRTFHPERLHAGSTGRVDLAISNRSRRRSPVAVLRGPLADGTEATIWIPPLRGGSHHRAIHTMPASRRGPQRIDAITIDRTDPLGLARRNRIAVPEGTLLVLPRIDQFKAATGSHGLATGDGPADPSDSRSGASDDFSALRPYVHGDDLRRVHWRSSARTEELIVRENEPLADGHVTILLDVRPGARGGRSDPVVATSGPTVARPGSAADDPLERAISAAAGMVEQQAHRGGRLRLVTTAGDDSGVLEARSGRDRLLEHLAWIVPTENAAALDGPAARLVPTIVFTARPDASLGALVTSLRPRPPVYAFVTDDGELHAADPAWVRNVTTVRPGTNNVDAVGVASP